MEYARFEKVYNASPHVVRDYHPNGSLIAMQIYAEIPRTTGPDAQAVRNAAIHVLQKMKRPVTSENLTRMGVKDGPTTDIRLRGAIWNLQSGSLVLAPTNTIDLAWLHQGREIGLLREHSQPLREKPSVFGSLLQSEFAYTWERGSWPERKHLHSCPLLTPTGWPVTVTLSPCSDLAVFQWKDQTESGLEFIAISDQGDHQVMDTRLPILEQATDHCFRFDGNGFPIGSNLLSPPAFSPDGRYIVFTWQKRWNWWTEETNPQHAEQAVDLPPQRDACSIGFAEIIDWEQRQVREIALLTTLPQDWVPPSTSEEAQFTREPPTFIDNEHFVLLLPTNERKTYSLHEEGPTTRLIAKTSQALIVREQAILERRRKRER